MNVIKASIRMTNKPSENSKLETECLFGEELKVLDSFSDWLYCRLLTDNYLGWIKKKFVDQLQPATHRIVSKRSFLFSKKNIKSNYIDYLPLGAKLSVIDIDRDWAKVNLSNNNTYKIAYTPSKHLISLKNNIKDWVSVAEQMVGTPYKWGGRDTIGLDCSALLQLSYQTYGQDIPRNTVDQINLKKEIITDINKLERGFVIFWKGHVGIMVDKLNCIHANAFHMQTRKETLNDIILRMNKESHIIKMMNFN
jgi:cell wall-associated NlpC family hydrolase